MVSVTLGGGSEAGGLNLGLFTLPGSPRLVWAAVTNLGKRNLLAK